MDNIQTIPTHTDWSPELISGDSSYGRIVQGLDDIEQCLRIILTSPAGCDPHRPDFASEIHKYIDNPQPTAKAYLVRAITRAILKYEPRVAQVKVSILLAQSQDNGGLEITINWLPTDGGNWNSTVINAYLRGGE